MEHEIKALKEALRESRRMVFFGGAGVSTESGIPDFRSTDGLYNQTYRYPPETILSHSFFLQKPEEFFAFYRDKMLVEAQPNVTHKVLAELERQGKCTAVITQNIDGLHQMAGSKTVFELHGSVHRNHCMKCARAYGLEAIRESQGVPRCECGGVIKPDVVLYEEGLDNDTVVQAVRHIERADLLIVGGTSLNVYPAAGMLQYFNGKTLALINKSATPYDRHADILLHRSLGEVFSQLL